ncbi:MAG: hypothetical protein PHC71_03045 [Candidatus Omnitrophica bacterium]|nr:hypothetical protein [Candidatus Omnitrophota bacterium]
MKINTRRILIAICCLSSVVLSGCTTIKEAAKGFAGVSTRILEEGRKEALKKSFALDYDSCYAKVKDILKEGGKEEEGKPYVYAEDAQKKMLAVYLSETDTTPVGIFFSQEQKGATMIEISSPSIYAKEYIAAKVFGGIDALLKPKEEKKADVKQEISN